VQGVRLPMRKINPTTTSADSAPPTPHSPLSPMIPSSPLYPDGLIAPVWVRKHAKLVPSVFVLFLRLFESPNHSDGQELSADEAQKKEAGDREREKAEDELLVREIGERRRRLGERGIKLTVVLMASASTLGLSSCRPPDRDLMIAFSQTHQRWIRGCRISVGLPLFPPKPHSSSSPQSPPTSFQTSFNRSKMPYTTRRWSTTRPMPSEFGENELAYLSISLR